MDKETMQELLKENYTNIKNDMENLFKLEISKITNEVREFKNSLEFLSSKYDQLILDNKSLKDEVNCLKKTNKEQNLKIENLEDGRRQSSKRLSSLENLSRYNNIELHGIKSSAGEKNG